MKFLFEYNNINPITVIWSYRFIYANNIIFELCDSFSSIIKYEKVLNGLGKASIFLSATRPDFFYFPKWIILLELSSVTKKYYGRSHQLNACLPIIL